MKGSKFLIGILAVLIVVLSIMLGMNIKVYMDNQKEKEAKIQKVEEILKNQENLDEDVKEAVNQLYSVTGDNKNKVIYEYNQDNNYIMEKFLKDKYYIFNVIDLNEDGGYKSARKCNYMVNKSTSDANVYFAGGQMIGISDGNSWKVDPKYEKYYYNMDKEVKKAYERIYEYTGEGEYKCAYDPESEEHGNKEFGLNGKYYIFSDYNLEEDGNFGDEGDSCPAVKKDNMELYRYSPGGYPDNLLVSYEEYYKPEPEPEPEVQATGWQRECMRIHVPYGYPMCQSEESHRMQRRDLSSSSLSGCRGNTNDIQQLGYDWYLDECVSMHGGVCQDLYTHQSKMY